MWRRIGNRAHWAGVQTFRRIRALPSLAGIALGAVMSVCAYHLLDQAMPAAFGAGHDKIDPRSKKLLQELFARRKLPFDHQSWLPEHGPWAPYLNEPFHAGLSATAQKHFAKATTLGDCQTVTSLLVAGFVQKHPYLQAAHGRYFLGRWFVKTVLPTHHDYLFCTYHRLINRAETEIRRSKLTIAKPYAADRFAKSDVSVRPSETRAALTQATLCNALSHIAALAAFHDHRPAIKLLVAQGKGRRLARLPPRLDYYLLVRAQALKLSVPVSTARRNKLARELRPKQQCEIADYARTRLGQIPFRPGWDCPGRILPVSWQ